MSADNGVYILGNKGSKRGRKEYRVTYADARVVSDIFPSDINPNNGYDKESRAAALQIFGECRVFTDRKIAEGYAERVAEESLEKSGYLEYGIVLVDHSYARFPRQRRRSTPNRTIQRVERW